MARFSFDTRFRPLLSATIASGLVALAMFDFAANIWDALRHPASRGLISAAARTAYAGFFLQALMLLGVYLAGSRVDRLGAAIANLLGAGLFLWCSFVVGGLSSIAFNYEAPAGVDPPESVALFFAVSVLIVIAFGLWLAGRIGLAALRSAIAARRDEQAADAPALAITDPPAGDPPDAAPPPTSPEAKETHEKLA